MNIETAKEIARLTCVQPRQLIQAIKLLRYESAFGLIAAKVYLESNSANGEQWLFSRLCADFVQDKRDLLTLAKIDLDRLTKYIEQLEFEIGEESHEIHGV